MTLGWILRPMLWTAAVVAFLVTWYSFLPFEYALTITLLFLVAAPLIWAPEPVFVGWFWSIIGALMGYFVGSNLALLGYASSPGYMTAGGLAWLLCTVYATKKQLSGRITMTAVGVPACFLVRFLTPTVFDGDFSAIVRTNMLICMITLAFVGIITMTVICLTQPNTKPHET